MIHVEDEFYIDADVNCYTLREAKGKTKKGEPIWTVYGYYSTLREAIRGYKTLRTRKIVNEHENTLASAIAELEALNDHFEKLLGVVRE